MSEQKRIVSIKKSSLAGLSYEWGDECYAFVTPATYEDNLAIEEMDTEKMTKREQIDYQMGVVKKHFVSGKIKIFNGETFELSDMTEDDAVSSLDIANKLYADIIGFDLDPKDLRKAAEEKALQGTSESSTEATSSTATQ